MAKKPPRLLPQLFLIAFSLARITNAVTLTDFFVFGESTNDLSIREPDDGSSMELPLKVRVVSVLALLKQLCNQAVIAFLL